MGINIVALQKPLKMSNLTVDADLAMGAHDITLGVLQTVDGKDVGENPKVSDLDADADLVMGAHAITINAGGLIDGKDVSAITKAKIDIAANDTLNKSHDAETTTTVHADYEKVKTITLTRPVSGTARIKFDLGTNNATYLAYGRVYKNGVALGTAQSTLNTHVAKETFSEDLAVGDMAEGDTLELWAKATDGYESRTENFRIYGTIAHFGGTNS